MPWWIDGKLEWSVFAVVIAVGAGAVAMVSVLAFVLDFDLSTSPAWQVGVFHLALFLLLSLTFVAASRRPFSFSGGFRRFSLGMAILVPVGVVGHGWIVGGPLEGFRDERVFTWVTVSVAIFMVSWLITAFAYMGFVVTRVVWRCRRSGLPYEGLCEYGRAPAD